SRRCNWPEPDRRRVRSGNAAEWRFRRSTSGWSLVRIEGDTDARLVAVVRLDKMFHPAREQHQQAGIGCELDIAVAVGHGAFDIAVDHAGARVAECEFAGTGRYFQIEA